MSVRAGRGRGRLLPVSGVGSSAPTHAVVGGAELVYLSGCDSAVILLGAADSLPIVVGESAPASMPPLDMDLQVYDTPVMRLAQAALHKARLKIDQAQRPPCVERAQEARRGRRLRCERARTCACAARRGARACVDGGGEKVRVRVGTPRPSSTECRSRTDVSPPSPPPPHDPDPRLVARCCR
jgi:hypothetical protein